MKIRVHEKEISGCNVLHVQVGTNCPQGGDTGHGGRTIFGLTDLASTDMRLAVNGGSWQQVRSFSVVLGGDSEHDTLVEALEYALTILKADNYVDVP